MWKRNAAVLALALLLATTAGAEEESPVVRQVQAIQVQALQQEMLSDPMLFTEILALQSSPVFQRIMEDPELLARIRSGDLDSLRNDPKLAALADDPVVRKLAGDLEK